MSGPYYSDETIALHHGDALNVLQGMESGSVDCLVTSPPYFGLRDYGIDGQIGAEPTPAEYVAALVAVFSEARRVLASDGTCWLNLGDSYAADNPGGYRQGYDLRSGGRPKGSGRNRAGTRAPGFTPKNLLGMPWRVAFALQDDGWILRNAIVWHKPNAMPESVTDRLSTRYELLFLFSKSRRYWFDLDPIREPLKFPDAADGSRVFGGVNKSAALLTGSSARRTGAVYGKAAGTKPNGRNPGDVWSINTAQFPSAHFAAFPPELPRRCILAGCKPDGTVLDPFHGSGTTGMVALQLGRKYIGIDLNAEYLDLSLRTRLADGTFAFGGET